MKRQSQESMFALIEQMEHSALSKREFCSAHDIAYTTFQYWFTKYNKAGKGFAENESSGFIPLDLGTVHSSNGAIEMVFPKGIKIIFHHAVQADFLRSLLT